MGGKTRNIDAIQLVLQQCCKTSFTFFFYRFTVPLDRTEMTKSSLCGGGGGRGGLHKRNHEKDSGNSMMKTP